MGKITGRLFHITPISSYLKAIDRGEYASDTLESEGFIHCSLRDQVLPVAETWFKGQNKLLLLEINPEKLLSEVRMDPVPGAGEYPHIYGVLNLDAITVVWEFEPDTEGHFHFPTVKWMPEGI